MVRNPATAEDLTVETFWRIHRARNRFEPDSPFAPWARRIATRVALDWLRAQRPEVELTAEMAECFALGVGGRSRHRCRDSPEDRAGLRPAASQSPRWRQFWPWWRSSRTKKLPRRSALRSRP